MKELFTTILNMSITASYIAVAVIVARLFLKKTPKIFSYVLWLAVLVRLVIPFSFPSSFSLLNLLSFMRSETQNSPGILEYIPGNFGMMKTPAVDTGISSISNSINSMLPAARQIASVNPVQVQLALAQMIWLAGIAVLLLYSIVSYVKVSGRIKTATLVNGNVFETDRINTPFLFGFVRPRIYVPTGLSQDELSYIVMHEQTHLKRLDYLIKPLAYLVLVVHWFNPLMWLCFKLMSKDMEMSCDESVLKKMGNSVKTSYSNSLLSLSIRDSGLTVCSPLAFGESNIKSRIKNIVDYRKPALWVILAGIALTAVLILVFISNPKVGQIISAQESDYPTEVLMKNKTPYVGNNSKVVALIDAVKWPEGVIRKTVALQTKAEPYGITINFDMDNAFSGSITDAISSDTYYRNCILLLSLIDNVTSITCIINDDSSSSTGELSTYHSFSYTREMADTLLGKDVREFSETKRDLEELILKIQNLQFNTGKVKADNADLVFPLKLSENELKLENGGSIYVNLEMTGGKYFSGADVEPGGGIYDNNYQGEYQLRVSNPLLSTQGSTASIYPNVENDFDESSMNFNGSFDLVFDDYNNDGNPDFILGQWGGSNGSLYNLYTLDKKGVITRLETGGPLYIADHAPSVQLEKLDKTSFSVKYYDNSVGKELTKTYIWKDNKFNAVKK